MALIEQPDKRTYGTVERLSDGAGWRITEIEPHVAIRLKAIFPRVPKTGRPPFDLRGGPSVDADLAWFMERYPLRVAADDRARIVERKTLFELGQAEIGSILSPTWKPSAKVAFREGRAPYNYQAQAAELVRRTGRLLLMDDLGLGKTISSFAAICHPDSLPAAVVVQAHLPAQWVKRFEEFTHLKVHVIKVTTPYVLPPADVYVFKYSNIGGWVDYFAKAPFVSVVCDEAQELRNGVSTSKGRAARELLAHARLKLFLTATPIYNYGSEIFHLMNLLEEGCLGTWHDFIIEWCKMGPGGKWVVNDPQALGTYLREQHLALRRTEIDVEGEMPPPNVIMHEVAMDDEALAKSEALARELAMKVTFKSTSFTERGQASREFDLLMRQMTGPAAARMPPPGSDGSVQAMLL